MNIGISSCGKVIDRALFEDMRALGISHLEISVPDAECDALDLNGIAAMARDNGITLWSYHLPFAPFARLNPASPDANVRAYTIERFKKLIGDASAVGIKTFIIHASGEPIREEDRPAALDCAKDSLARLAAFARERGATIAVEDLPRTCLGRRASDILELISADADLRVCYDTNHITLETPEVFLAQVAGKIVTTHVSDYDFIDEKHWLPGEGQIDWPALIAALKATGYDGPWLYEIGYKTPDTIKRGRDLVLKDFADNAKRLGIM